MTAADADIAQRTWASLLGDVDLRVVDIHLGERARSVAAQRVIRGMDAVYLAVALQFAESAPTGLLSFDVRQRSVLTADDGVQLLPAGV